MVENIKKYSAFMNVTGSESALAMHLYNLFLEKGFDASIDCNGSVLVRISGCGEKRKKVLLCAPIDNPGFISLYQEKDVAYLTPTDKTIPAKKDLKDVCDEGGKSFELRKSRFSEEEFCIKGCDFNLGQAFRLPSCFSENSDKVFGRFVARYALIECLAEICDEKYESDLLICFTTGFHSPAKSEANVAFRERPDSVILLGFTEEKTSYPILMMKDGKHFSSHRMSEKLRFVAKQVKIPLISKACDSEVTKAVTIAVPGGTEIVSLALPCQKPGTSSESISLKALNSMRRIISEFLSKA